MTQVLGIKFQDYGMVYYFDDAGHNAGVNDIVVVQTEQGLGIGRVVAVCDSLPVCVAGMEIKPVTRLATEKDLRIMHENATLADEAAGVCRTCVRENNLDMKIVGVEVFFDRSKMVFYFTSPGRVDFRELVKTLVKLYRSRIEMRQIGVRHETQMVGGIGNCGMVCCCRSMLKKFASATIKMAKEQNLFLTPPKISGACGRLLCCLSYEHDNYEEFHRQCPKIGKKFKTDIGLLKVLRANFFQQSVEVQNEENIEQTISLRNWATLNPRRVDNAAEVEAFPLYEHEDEHELLETGAACQKKFCPNKVKSARQDNAKSESLDGKGQSGAVSSQSALSPKGHPVSNRRLRRKKRHTENKAV